MNKMIENIIPIQGLGLGEHIYHQKIDDKFFEEFPESEIQKGDLSLEIKVIKNNTFYSFEITIEGTVEVICDRCLEPFNLAIKSNNQFIVKYSQEGALDEDDIIMIPPETNHFDLSPHIYDFVHLALPYKKVHAHQKDCNQETLRKLNEYQKKEDTDPRWDQLKKLFNNTNNN